MLEKAINYVKFLQLQIKVLATDEFWPAQGGKAPELSQVKDALDAILSSQHPNKWGHASMLNLRRLKSVEKLDDPWHVSQKKKTQMEAKESTSSEKMAVIWI